MNYKAESGKDVTPQNGLERIFALPIAWITLALFGIAIAVLALGTY